MIRRPLAVLVADPDPIICETISEMLKAHGHAVTAVTETTPATRLLDLVLFDVLMVPADTHPSMLDLSFARLVRAKQPDTRIIGISGDIDQPTATTVAAIDAFLRKPFTLEQLGTVLRQLTGEKAACSPTDKTAVAY